MKNIFKTLLSFSLFFVFAQPASALYVKTGDNLILDQKRYDESVIVAGNNLEIKSDINGDLICAGQSITISGRVSGDIICAGQNLTSKGDTDGNFRAAGQTINLGGRVGKNVSVVGQTFTLNDKASVKSDTFFAGQTINLLGFLGRDLIGASESLNLGSITNRNATLAFRTLNLSSNGGIKGNLDYYYEKGTEPKFDTKNIKGTITKHEITPPAGSQADKQKMESARQSFITFGRLVWFISHLLITLIAVLIFKNFVKLASDHISTQFWASLGTGFAVLILTPLACLILGFTLIGFPIGFILFLIYVLALMTSGVYVGSAVGEAILVKYLKQKQLSLLVYTLAGVAFILLLSRVPVIGFFVGLINLILGLGGFSKAFFKKAQ